MAKRKRVPLKLKGTDEQYFRTKEITGDPVELKEVSVPTKPDTPKEVVPKPAPKPVKPKTPSPIVSESTEGEIVSRIVHLGTSLTKRLHATAEAFDVSIDDLLYAARKKAIKRFRQKLDQSKKPSLESFEKGGETLRIAISLSAAELDKLKGWYDPLDVGTATKAVSPLITSAFRNEIEIICSPKK